MKTLIIIQIIIFVAYVAYVWHRFGVLSSISASSYRLHGNEKGIFSGWLILLGLTSCGYIYFDVLGIWAGFMAVGFAMSGMSPDHKRNPNSMEDFYHTFGTAVAIFSLFLGQGLMYDIWLPGGIFLIGAFLLWLVRRNWIWWTEIWGMATGAFGLFNVAWRLFNI